MWDSKVFVEVKVIVCVLLQQPSQCCTILKDLPPPHPPALESLSCHGPLGDEAEGKWAETGTQHLLSVVEIV